VHSRKRHGRKETLSSGMRRFADQGVCTCRALRNDRDDGSDPGTKRRGVSNANRSWGGSERRDEGRRTLGGQQALLQPETNMSVATIFLT